MLKSRILVILMGLVIIASLADAGEQAASRQKTLPTTLADAMKTLADADALLLPDIPPEAKP